MDNANKIAGDIVGRFEGETFVEAHDAEDLLVSEIVKSMGEYLAQEPEETTHVSQNLHKDLLEIIEIQHKKIASLREALQLAVDLYGKEGGPWNVPSSKGSWIAQAKEVLNVT